MKNDKTGMDYDKIFEEAHDKGAELLGTRWLKLNENAAHVASMMGIDHRDKKMRAFISKLILETAEGMLEMDNIQKEKMDKRWVENSKKK